MINSKRKKTKILLTVIVGFITIIIWIYWSNTVLIINHIKISGDNLPQSFEGFRIAQISDLHNAELGEKNINLVEKLAECDPDIIVITGDIIDSHHTNIDVSVAFAKKATEMAPTYFVTGNHEVWLDENEYNELIDKLTDSGIIILQNESVTLKRNNERVRLVGVDDPSFNADYLLDEVSVMNSNLSELIKNNADYTVLLSHRPELFNVYVSGNVDLVLSGHAHGGQFRLPFLGGVVAPGQGLFPKYDSGCFTENATNMIVSRGIGNSIIPFRINNGPEIILVELCG